nr:hypothetical protein [Pelagibacterales bacterium]
YGFPDPKVIVFAYENNQWIEKQTIQPDGYKKSDQLFYTEKFGNSIACNDEWLFISDNKIPNNNFIYPNENNLIYIYKRDEQGSWNQMQTIESPSVPGDNFAREMIVSNNALIVSSENYKKNESSKSFGTTFIYKLYEQNNQWLLFDTIEFDYRLEAYEECNADSLCYAGLPSFSESISGNNNILTISAPGSIGSTTNYMQSSHQGILENRAAELSNDYGVVFLYKFNERDEQWQSQFIFDSQSFLKYKFGSWLSTHFTYDEYDRIVKSTILSLETVPTSTGDASSKENFSGGKIIIKSHSYNTFPIDKSISNLKGLGQSFNTKLTLALTKTIPFINTSSSPNGIVALPLDIHPAYSAVFEKYAKISAPNKKAIHILIQKDVNETEVVYLRAVLSKMLSNKDGSLYGANKTGIFNSMSSEDLIIGIFRNSTSEESSDTLFLTGEFNINIEIINQDDIDINVFLNTNETIGMLTESIYMYGIFQEDPNMKSALNAARVQAEGSEVVNPNIDFQFNTRSGKVSPKSFSISQKQDERSGIFHTSLTDQEEKNIRYLRLGVEVYYGMWDHDPNATGKSGDNEYSITSKDQMQKYDPGLFDIVNGFFPEDINVY